MTNTIALSSGILIGDRWLTSGERQMEHVNPTSGQVQAEFPVASDEVVDEAVASARDGQRRWAAFAPEARAAALHRVADQLRQRADELTAICIEETGLPAGIAAFHAPHAARWFDYYAGWADRIHGKTITIPGSMDLTIAEPFGVVACVTTWNGPIVGTAMGAAAPLAAGCAVVLKPPELGPFSSRLLDVEGGTLSGITLHVSSVPDVKPGERAVLFLDENGSMVDAPHNKGLGILKLDPANRVADSSLSLNDIRTLVRAAAGR